MAMIKIFSVAVLLLTVDAAAVTDMQSLIRRQAPPLEVQVVQINDQGDSSLMQKSVSAPSGDVCSTNTVYRGDQIGTKKDFQRTKCKTLAECQESCVATNGTADANGDATASCIGFNWWPKKGKCKLFSALKASGGEVEENRWITIAANSGSVQFTTGDKCTITTDMKGSGGEDVWTTPQDTSCE